MNLIIVRHGQTNLNRDGRVLGHGPEPLNETGLAQVGAVARALAHVDSFTLYSSPVNRTMQTAEAISRLTGAPITPKPGLAELDAGEMEGIEGRKLGEVQDRAWKAIAEIVDAHPDGTAVAVSHNFPIQTIVCSALGMNLKDFRRVKVDLGSITRLQTASSGFTVTSLNETWHLPPKNPAG